MGLLSLDCGRKHKYLGETQANAGRVCKTPHKNTQTHSQLAGGFKSKTLLPQLFNFKYILDTWKCERVHYFCKMKTKFMCFISQMCSSRFCKVAKSNRMTDIRILIILCEWLLWQCVARLPIEWKILALILGGDTNPSGFVAGTAK